MRLKSLEIKGFKSFADKTVLNFDEGITGVIGPNGCGKSNIIDSIRWVIGEHKISNLRSENLESLVFNGSKTRSASGLAEVSLTFENTKNLLPTEFSTVTVTRKYYKSGESEYRLNDVSCRLKDIHNLFMDTGISTDSYAIIELGMVDDIIKDKDNSRRKMLEQAAGITIYKTRKREAKLKLDATEQDLARIEDLLFEINNQLKSLESQAKKAEKFYEIKKEFKIVSIELAKAALEGFNITYKTLNGQQQTEVDKRIELETAIATEDAALEVEKLAFVEREKALQQLQQSYNALLDKVRHKENDKNLSEQRLQYLQNTQVNLKAFLDKAGGQQKSLQDSLSFTGKNIEEEKEKLASIEKTLEGLKETVEEKRVVFDKQRTEIDELRRKNQELQRTLFEAEKTVAVADTSIQNIEASLKQLSQEEENRKEQISTNEAKKVEAEKNLAEKKASVEAMQLAHETAKVQILKAQSTLEDIRNNLAAENRTLDAKVNEYDLVKSLVDSMDGYPESVKFLHNNKNWNHTAPLLSDVIYVKEEYRAAVENVLEPYLNYYIVQDVEEAMQAVNLLDREKKGKANFFMLDKISAKEKAVAPEHTTPALDVIEVDGTYGALAAHLLANVFIATNEEAYLHSGDAVILEKTGKYVKGKYSVTGGSVGLFEGKKIGRAKNMEKLQAEIETLKATVKSLQEKLGAKQQEILGYNAQLKEKEIVAGQQEINRLHNEAFSYQNRLENLLQAQTSAGKNTEELTARQAEKNAAIVSTREALVGHKSAMESLTATLQTVEGTYQEAEQAYNAVSNALNDNRLQLTRQQSKIASLEQELNFKSNQLAELQTQVTTSNAELEDTTAQQEKNVTELEQFKTELHGFLQTKEVEEKRLNTADQEFHNLRNALTEKETALKRKQKEKEGIDLVLTEIKDKLTELKLQLAGIKERLSVEFKVDIDEVLAEDRETDTPLEVLQEKSERMRKRLDNMGEVNPTAIEAYTEMNKRYEFIVEQKDDLVSAKDSLLQTIQEVETTANQQFLDTFNKTRENFQKVFKALFTEEDTADMIMIDPDNLSETGIDIVAKPKGKRPSSIGQLSGGEKTLTATALLFAIYLIKPAPFCILDEVDAPLDDANVGKFTNMIKQFSENSQFIIVTHNKMTMSAVDVIYGVTMQEAGVSKLVPVDFRSLN